MIATVTATKQERQRYEWADDGPEEDAIADWPARVVHVESVEDRGLAKVACIRIAKQVFVVVVDNPAIDEENAVGRQKIEVSKSGSPCVSLNFCLSGIEYGLCRRTHIFSPKLLARSLRVRRWWFSRIYWWALLICSGSGIGIAEVSLMTGVVPTRGALPVREFDLSVDVLRQRESRVGLTEAGSERE